MIITDIETLKKYIPTIAIGIDDINAFGRYQNYLQDAERWLRREITGRAILEIASSTDPEPEDELVTLCQAVVAHKAYLDAIPMLDLVETPNGFAVHGDGTLAPASAVRVESLKKGIAAKLDDCVEDLIDYLEENEEYHDDWKGSPSYSLVNDNYILSLRQFRKYAPFEGNRLEFIKARPNLTRARMQLIEPVISEELSLEVIEELRDGELSETNKKIIEDLRFALAGFATGDTRMAESSLARVRKKLIANPEGYPAFMESAQYEAYLLSLEPKPEDETILPCV